MEELREVLAVKPGEPNLEADNLVNNISRTLSQCGGSLLVVDEEYSTVSFVHESVRQFSPRKSGKNQTSRSIMLMSKGQT